MNFFWVPEKTVSTPNYRLAEVIDQLDFDIFSIFFKYKNLFQLETDPKKELPRKFQSSFIHKKVSLAFMSPNFAGTLPEFSFCIIYIIYKKNRGKTDYTFYYLEKAKFLETSPQTFLLKS